MLFTTGYAGDAIIRAGRLEAGISLMNEPVTLPILQEGARCVGYGTLSWQPAHPLCAPRALACSDDFRGLAYETMNATIMATIASVREIPSTQRTTPVVRPWRASVAVFTAGGRSDIAAIPLLR